MIKNVYNYFKPFSPNVSIGVFWLKNKDKIREFKRILGSELEIVQGKDLKEVDSDVDTVILYKSLDAGEDFIVEDTILTIDGKEIVDIRWFNDYQPLVGKEAAWIVSLAYNDGLNIYVYRGVIKGVIVYPENKEGFGFDPYFRPIENNNGLSIDSDKTLADYEREAKKDNFSARVLALSNLKNKYFINSHKIIDIPIWDGKYQNS